MDLGVFDIIIEKNLFLLIKFHLIC